MRWKWKSPEAGDKKIKRKFLIFPLCIDDDCRWLKMVKVEYEYQDDIWGSNPYDPYSTSWWKPKRFID